MKNYKGFGVSLPLEMHEWLQRKVQDNRPRIASVSHYIQCLLLNEMEKEKQRKAEQ